MKTNHLEGKIVQFLEDGPRTITEIRDHLNAVTCHGTSMNQLANILGKRRKFEKVGTDRVRNYNVSVWALAEVA